MGPNESICRICLRIIEEELPHSVLRGNEALMEDLKLICPLIFNNLHLTEEPSICDLCETTIREFAIFKRFIVSTEEKHDSDANFAKATCRMCLQNYENLTTSWEDCLELFQQCNLFMLLNFEGSNKVCDCCVGTLESLNDFLQRAAELEAVIVVRAKKMGKLSFEDLFSISLMNKTTKNHVEEPLQVTITKTPNTYEKKRLKCDMPSTSKESQFQETEQLEEKFTRIDASPATITDFTFGEIDNNFKLALEPSAENLEVNSNNEITTLGLVEYEISEVNVPSSEEFDENSTEIEEFNENLTDIEEFNENSAQVVEAEEFNGNSTPEELVEEIVPQETKVTTRKRKVKAVANENGTKIKKLAKEIAEKPNKPVDVVIIKSAKKTKKAELDKTWQELTGKPNKETFVEDCQAGVDIQLVSTKRGRPKVPETQRKSTKKRNTIWYYCDLCSFKSYSQNSLVSHQLIHNLRGTDTPNFQCDLCDFNTPSAEMMRAHKSNHPIANITYKCIFCDETFKKKITCMYHTLKHDDQDVASQFYCMAYNGANQEEFFECYQCTHQDVEESSMPDHVIGHTVETVKTCLVTTYKCDQCLYITKNQELLERHKTMHKEMQDKKKQKEEQEKKKRRKRRQGVEVKQEPDEDAIYKCGNEDVIYKCDKCLYMTKNKRSLANHKGLKHNRRPVQPSSAQIKKERPLYYCNECSYSTHRKVNLPRHQLVHRTKKNLEFFECSNCIFETKHRRSYTRHMESVHGLIS